jgi:hypothetical protein
MPKATVRAAARTLPKSAPHPDAEILALAEQCIAAYRVRNEAAEALRKSRGTLPGLRESPGHHSDRSG